MKKFFIVTLFVLMILVGCNETESIGIRGDVVDITKTENGTTILVEGTVEKDTVYDKASVRVNEDTKIEGVSSIEAMKKGMKVEVIFTGAVAESYPVQGVAKRISVIK